MKPLHGTSALAAGLAIAALSLACNKQPEPIPRDNPEPAASAASSPAAPAANPHAAAPGTPSATDGGVPAANGPEDIGYDAPKAWASAPNPSPMRKATFKIPKQGGEPEDAELAISAASGGVEPNIKRWEGQFGDAKAKTEKRTVNGLPVTVVEIKGKFAGGGMMGAPSTPKDNQMLLGAVVDGGDRQFFFKMTGGEKTVSAAKKDFDAFVSSFRGK